MMLGLRQFRSQIHGVSDFLPYAALITPDVILCKDGSFLAGFFMRGQDSASCTADELAFISAQFNNAIKLLGSGWMLHVDAVKSQYHAYSRPEESFFPDSVSKIIDDERRQFFSGDYCFKTKSIIILTYKPSYNTEKISSATVTKSVENYATEIDRSLEYFQSTLTEFEDALTSILKLHRLTEYAEIDENFKETKFNELLSHLQLCVSGIEQPVRVPQTPMYLDALLGSDDLIGGLTPKIGDQNISVLSIDGLPQESWPAILSILDGLQLQYRFSSRFICLDQYDAQKEINSYRKGWKQNVFKFLDKFFNLPNARPNRDALAMVEDAEQALTEVQSGYVGAGFLSSCIVLLHDDSEKLTEWAREIRRALLTLGFGCRIESINVMEAWLGSHPGNWFANIRRPIINTLNLADLLPLSSIWSGERYSPCPFYPPNSPSLMVCTTNGSTPFHFNLHVRDIGHTLIFGPIGAGKSTLLALIAAQFRRYKDSQVFAFDKGMSMYALCRAVGGTHYNVGHGDALSFAPLQNIDNPSEQMWAEEFIANLLQLQKISITPRIRNDIHEALQLVAKNPKDMRSLSHLSNLVQDQQIKDGLKHYTRSGAMGYLLDAESDNLGISKFMTFEIEELMNLGNENLIPVLLYLFHRIEKSLYGQPCIIILDEAWIMLGNPVFRAKIREWLKVLRKANCAVVMATQSLSDAKNSGILDVLVESCQTKVFLPNITARQDIQKNLYLQMGLNERQIVEIIAGATPKRDYYVVTPYGCRLIQLNLQKKALAFVAVSDKEQIARINEYIDNYAEQWPEKWLNDAA